MYTREDTLEALRKLRASFVIVANTESEITKEKIEALESYNKIIITALSGSLPDQVLPDALINDLKDLISKVWVVVKSDQEQVKEWVDAHEAVVESVSALTYARCIGKF